MKLALKICVPCERSNRPAAANRAEETRVGVIVAWWKAVPLKTDVAMVRTARV